MKREKLKVFIRNHLILFTTVMIIVSGLPTNLEAKSSEIVKKDGYRIAIDWKNSGDKLRVRGMIKEGKLCKNLDVSLFLKNKKGGIVHIEDSVHYQTKHGVQFKGSDEYYKRGKISKSKDWYVSNIYLECN